MSEAGRSCNETILYPATKAYTRYGGGSEYHDSRSHSKVLKSSPNISIPLSFSLPISISFSVNLSLPLEKCLHFLQFISLNFKLFTERERERMSEKEIKRERES